MQPTGYLINVGEADRMRLNALGAIYNPTSMHTLNTHAGSNILDVGCGNGCLTNLIALLFNEVVAVDNNQKQLDIAKESGSSNISYELCDVYRLTDLKEKHPELFDVVYCRFVLTHLTDPEKAVDQMLTMVKPGGHLIIEESGARKRFKGTPPKCIQAWAEMVQLQYEKQKSHIDTCDRVYTHLKDKVSSCKSHLFNILIEGQEKKCLFRLGAEQGLSKFITVPFGGYESGQDWINELKQFEEDDLAVLKVENYECVIARKLL